MARWPHLFAALLAVPALAQQRTLKLDFSAAPPLVFSDAEAWRFAETDGDVALDLHAASDYQPPHRSPHNIALLATPAFGSFTLEADLMQTGREYGHRDMCVFFCFQSPTRYGYLHLATEADDNAHQVMLVDGAPRRPITTRRSDGVDWGTSEWHRVRVEFDADARNILVLFDDELVLQAHDVPLDHGYVGFGSFDDTGRIDNVRITGDAASDEPPEFFERWPAGRVTLTELPGRVRVEVDGELFTEYVYEGVTRPHLHPIIGPHGLRMTRSFPLEQRPGEARDHPHHTSMWWAHGDMSGSDVWHAPGRLVPRSDVRVRGDSLTLDLDVTDGAGGVLGSCTQTVTFGAEGETRTIDFEVELRGIDTPLVLGDTKEGTMAIRTHPALRLRGGEGVVPVTGRARNSEGVTGKDVWGKRAAWIDYWGKIQNRPVGIAILDHPANPRHPTWWQARDYGLVAANPFGQSAFEADGGEKGRFEIAPGERAVFRYRFLFHEGSWHEADIPGAFEAYAAEPVAINDDGGWCWFQDERAIIVDDTLIVGSVAAGVDDPTRRGDVELTVVDLNGGPPARIELHDRLELDDHDAPALLEFDTGVVLAVWAKHGPENRFYTSRASAGDLLSWSPHEHSIPSPSSRITYANLVQLSDEGGRIYNFFRGLHNSWKPSFALSDDRGRSWMAGNVVIDVPGAQRHRPYVRYASNGRDEIHLLYTEGHPRNYDNSAYHVVYRDGMLCRSDGSIIASLAEGLSDPAEGTRVLAGDADRVAWVADLELDGEDRPVAAISVQVGSAGLPVGSGGDDHRYHYARWDGERWLTQEMAFAGTRLYPREDDYTGLVAINPSDVDEVYISTNADPETGSPLISAADGRRHWEIFKGRTTDRAETWAWTPITENSTEDNIRPIMPRSDERPVLLWLRGVYTTYTNYDLRVMMLRDP